MVEIDHGVEGEESDEDVVGEVVVEEEKEVFLKGEKWRCTESRGVVLLG